MKIEHCDECKSRKDEDQTPDEADYQCNVCNAYLCDYCAQYHSHYYDKERKLWKETFREIKKNPTNR